MFSRPTLIHAGSLAQPAGNGGLAWFHLQFVLGFRRLGWDVLFLDRLSPQMCRNGSGQSPCDVVQSQNLSYFLEAMRRFALAPDSFSLAIEDDSGRAVRRIGLQQTEVLHRARDAVLINAMGFLHDPEILAAAKCRVFLDMDPGFGQMWRDLGLHDPFAGHDKFVTLGRNIGKPDCAIPTCGLNWITIPQPVVLEHWPVSPPAPAIAAFTSIGAWRGPNAPIQYKGRTYGLRCHEFRKFATLPRLCPDQRFEMALEIHAGDAKDSAMLADNGWNIVDPQKVAGDTEQYQQYICNSRGEIMIPKEIYVSANSGLLSDRSAYYLASGRPVLARDTGIGSLYPIGEGLLTFATLDEAKAGIEAINADYPKHCQTARQIAEEHFDSDKVLSRLLSDLQVA